MLRKVFKTGNSMVVSIPKDLLEQVGIAEGSEVSVELDQDKQHIVITPVEAPLESVGVDEKFAHQVAEFINQYRSALQELAKS